MLIHISIYTQRPGRNPSPCAYRRGHYMIVERTPGQQKKLDDILAQIRKDYMAKIENADTAESRTELLLAIQNAIDTFNAKEEEKAFKKLKGNHIAIIDSAKEQIDLVIDHYKKAILSIKSEEEMDGFISVGIVTRKRSHYFINATYIIAAIKDEIGLHLNALQNDAKACAEVNKAILDAVYRDLDIYTEDLESAALDADILDLKKPAISPIPNGESIAFLYKILNMKAGRNVLEEGNNRHNIISSLGNESKTMLRYTSQSKDKETYIEVTISQADEYLRKSRKTTEKVLTYVLQTMDNQFYPLKVSLNLKDMVDTGLYSTTTNAKRGVIEFFEQQKLITLKGTVKKNNQTIKEQGGILFYNYYFDKGKGIIELQMNENFNIDFIANYYSVFPRFAYALKNNNAFSLVRYIFYIARQRTRDIKETGTFTIKLDSIRENLGLPAVEEVKNRKFKQFIIDPIEKAIEDIEEELLKVPEAEDRKFTLTPRIPDTTNIKEWLDGYIEIGLSGDFAETFINIATKAEKDRKQWERIKLSQRARLEVQQEIKKGKPKRRRS